MHEPDDWRLASEILEAPHVLLICLLTRREPGRFAVVLGDIVLLIETVERLLHIGRGGDTLFDGTIDEIGQRLDGVGVEGIRDRNDESVATEADRQNPVILEKARPHPVSSTGRSGSCPVSTKSSERNSARTLAMLPSGISPRRVKTRSKRSLVFACADVARTIADLSRIPRSSRKPPSRSANAPLRGSTMSRPVCAEVDVMSTGTRDRPKGLVQFPPASLSGVLSMLY